jgi:hypothetical protein
VDLVRVPVVVQGRREVGAEMCSTRTCTCGRVFLSSRLFLCVPGVRSAQGRERRGVRVRWLMVGMARCPACPPLSCQEEEEEEERVGGEEPVQGGRWLWKNHPKPPIPSFRTMSNTTMVMPRGQAGRRPPPPAPPLRPRWLETWPRRRDLAKREPGGRVGWRRCLHPWDGATDGGTHLVRLAAGRNGLRSRVTDTTTMLCGKSPSGRCPQSFGHLLLLLRLRGRSLTGVCWGIHIFREIM